MELDYLAPFLARIGNPDKLTRSDASKVREECLGDLKQRLIDKANLIQARFEKVLSPPFLGLWNIIILQIPIFAFS